MRTTQLRMTAEGAKASHQTAVGLGMDCLNAVPTPNVGPSCMVEVTRVCHWGLLDPFARKSNTSSIGRAMSTLCRAIQAWPQDP
jgi:hypothetical protein